MAKITMAEYGMLAASVLGLPRRTRDMLENALKEKRQKEEQKILAGGNGEVA